MDFLDYLKAQKKYLNAKLLETNNALQNYSSPMFLEPYLEEYKKLTAQLEMVRDQIQLFKTVGTEGFDLDVECLNAEARVINNKYTLNKIDELTK